MSNIIFVSFFSFLSFFIQIQTNSPDLSNPSDLKALGIGKIIRKDKSVVNNIKLNEVKEYWIVYEKNGSLHDLMTEKITRLEFLVSKWGPIQIQFLNNRSVVLPLTDQ